MRRLLATEVHEKYSAAEIGGAQVVYRPSAAILELICIGREISVCVLELGSKTEDSGVGARSKGLEAHGYYAKPLQPLSMPGTNISLSLSLEAHVLKAS